jgi:Ca-activated chloride channel family protein
MAAAPRHAEPFHPQPRLRRKLLITTAVLAVAAGATVAAHAVRATTPCDPRRPVLEVAASPDIAPVVARIADELRDDGGCPGARVHAQVPSDVLAALTQRSTPPPDVWIPDSSLWVVRARDGQLVAPGSQHSIASSPLVLALPRALRDRLAPGGTALPWSDALAAVSAGQVVLRLPEEPAAPATVGLLAALQVAVGQEPDPRAALAALLHSAQLQAGLEDGGQALSTLGSSADSAVPVTEQAVFHHAGTPDAAPVAAVYPQAAGTPFDYPFAVLGAEGGLETTASRLRAAVRSPHGQALLSEAGFRGADGVADGLPADRGVDGTQPGSVAVPDVATADGLRRTLDAVRQDARLLAVVDLSGSMTAPFPGWGGSSRLDLALRAAAAGLELYPDSTEVGLWSFSEDVSGASDYQELVPIAPLAASGDGGRQALALAMTRMRAVPDGGTGLYDTTLAAVRTVRAGWDPARVNAVVLLTDGDDTDDDGIGLDELLATLRSEQESGQPVPVITVAYGDGDGDGAQSLAAISAATGGASYQVSDPGRIRDIFLDAVGQRACRPQCEHGDGN